MAQIRIPVPSFGGKAYSPDDPTQNTEELSRYLLELFTEAGSKGLVLDDGQLEEGSEEEFVFESIWNAQTLLIKQQQTRFTAVAGMLQEKKAALPEESALTALIDEIIDQGLETLKIWLVAKLAASALGSLAGGIVIPLTLAGIAYLRETYLTGEKLLEGLNTMMDSVIGGDMPHTKENFDMRALLIDQNERQLTNYLQEMLAAESQAGAGAGTGAMNGLEDINETLKLIAKSDASVQCPHTGQYIYRKSLALGQ